MSMSVRDLLERHHVSDHDVDELARLADRAPHLLGQIKGVPVPHAVDGEALWDEGREGNIASPSDDAELPA
jgi:hypothetical protein